MTRWSRDESRERMKAALASKEPLVAVVMLRLHPRYTHPWRTFAEAKADPLDRPDAGERLGERD